MKWLKIKLIFLTIMIITVMFFLNIVSRNNPTSKFPNASKQPDVNNTTISELVPLDIKLPKRMRTSPSRYRNIPNLEKPIGKPRPPFMVPVGTKNMALGKPVFSSDNEPTIGEIKMVTDVIKEREEGYYVELGPGLQCVTIDLNAEHDIYAIVIWHYYFERVYYDVIVQVANDPDFINIKTLFNNDIDNSAGFGIGADKHYLETYQGKLIDAGGIHGRYIRLYSNGNDVDDFNHYIEVEVYGKPVK